MASPQTIEQAWKMWSKDAEEPMDRDTFFAGAYAFKEMIYARLSVTEQQPVMTALNQELAAWRNQAWDQEEVWHRRN